MRGHPKRTLAAWGAAILVALVLIATALHGLSSSAHVNGTPQSTKAANLFFEGFPNEARAQAITDVIVVRSASHTVADPTYRAFVAGLVCEGEGDRQRDDGAKLPRRPRARFDRPPRGARPARDLE